MTTKTRKLANLINNSGDIKANNLDNVPPSGLDSAQVTAIASGVGLSVYSTLDNLPTSGLTSGDQAFVSSTNRFYISNGSGWYNVALINATPSLVVSPSGTVALAIDGSTPTFITLTATDSDNPIAALTYSVESDGNFAGLGTITQNIYDPEYNNGAIIDVTGNGSNFFKREVTTNGVRIMGAGTVGGQTAVPDAWLEKVARTFELFTDPDGSGINETSQRALIQNLSGDSGTYHAGFPTIQRVARGAGADYTPNFLDDSGISYWNLTNLFDNTVQNDMVWYLNSTGSGYGDGDNDAQEVIEHAFHTLHMHGLDAQSLKMYPSISSDWATGPLYNAMVEAYDAGKWDPSGYNSPANAFKTDGNAFEVAAKEYLFLLNFCMFEYSSLWEGGSLAPEWTDDMRTQAGILANNPLGYALHNTYIAPVISKPSLATIRSIFQDGNTPAQDDPSLAGASGYVVSPSNASFTITPLSEDSATTTSSTLTFKASDGINFGSGTSTLTLSFKVQYSNYTTFLAKADTAGTDDQVDASTNTHTITETGNVTSTALSPYHPGGYSTYFDGSGEYIQFPASNDWGFGTSAWTIEFWYNSTDTASHDVISAFNPSSPFAGWGVNVGQTGNGLVTMFFSNGSSSDGFDTVSGTTTINDGDWHHVVVTAPASSTTVTCYVDGVSAGSHTFTVAASTTGQILKVGCDTNPSPSRPMEGYVRDVRIVKGTAVYTSAFTPPTAPLTAIANTSLLTCHLPYIADGSSNNHAVTISGDPRTKRFGPYDYLGYTKAEHGGSVYFDGSSDWLTVTNSSEQMVPEAGDFTVECWFYTANASTRMDIYSSYTASTGFGIILNYDAGGKVTTYKGNTLTNNSAAGQFKANVWNHLAISRSGSSLKIFINGKAIYTNASDTTDYSGTSTLYINAAGNQTNAYTGWISDVRFVKGTAVYTSDFAPPTQPLTAITNTQLLTCTNKNDIWDAGNGGLLTKVGNATSSNTQRKFATSSAMYFDGTGDYITVADSTDFDFGTGDLTMEGWYYATDVSGDRYIFNFTTSVGNGHFGVNFYNGGWRVGLFNGNLITGTTGIETNVWHHFAWVRESGVMKFYIDGTQVGSNVTYSSALDCSGTFRIGTYAANPTIGYWSGYLQDLRITKGLARYTSAFTPPTGEFAG